MYYDCFAPLLTIIGYVLMFGIPGLMVLVAYLDPINRECKPQMLKHRGK